MSGKRRSEKAAREPVRATPVLRGPRETLRPPAAADAARRVGLHPAILQLFGDESGEA